MRILLTLAAAAGLMFAPLGASAIQNAAKTVTYNTAYHQTHPAQTAGEVTGKMRLTFGSSGTVSGTYRDEFAGGISTVAGGVNGTNIWLSFGSRGGHQFHGVMHKDGTISGTLSNWHGPRTYHFTAVPTTS